MFCTSTENKKQQQQQQQKPWSYSFLDGNNGRLCSIQISCQPKAKSQNMERLCVFRLITRRMNRLFNIDRFQLDTKRTSYLPSKSKSNVKSLIVEIYIFVWFTFFFDSLSPSLHSSNNYCSFFFPTKFSRQLFSYFPSCFCYLINCSFRMYYLFESTQASFI